MRWLCLFFICSAAYLLGNPFLIDFPDKQILTHADYSEIQSKLHAIDVKEICTNYFPFDRVKEMQFAYGMMSSADCFHNRMSTSLRATLIDVESECLPREIFEKVGRGGNCCVVNYVSYNRIYPQLAENILPALEASGFNGYFLCKIGGYPNPTGREAKYAGVPYAFKIFMVEEAFQRGFDLVLWVDAAVTPIKDIQPIFNYINRFGGFFDGYGPHSELSPYLFPKACAALFAMSRQNPLCQERRTIATIFGLKRTDQRIHEFMRKYYEIVEEGEPFLSQLPEGFVLSSILEEVGFGNEVFPALNSYQHVFPPPLVVSDSFLQESHIINKNCGPFFVHHPH